MNTYTWSGIVVPVAGDSLTISGIARAAGLPAASSSGLLVRLLRIKIGPSAATAAGIQVVKLIERSQADTGGTPTVQTPTPPYDAQDAAAQAPVTTFGTVPTTGGIAVPWGCEQLASGLSPAVGNLISWRWDDTAAMGANVGKVPILRHYANGGNAPTLALNFSAALAGQVCPVEIVWSESGG
jgi:hypothetical protein